MYKLGEFYSNGLIGPADKKTGREWLIKAARAGHPKAQFILKEEE